MPIGLHTRSLILITSATRRFTNLSKPLHNSHSLLIKRSLYNLKSPLLMASDNLSSSPSAVVEDDVAKYGFDRDEMYSIDLAGTVELYERHVFLCYKSPEDWPSRIEASVEDPLPKLFAAAMKARKQDITVKTKVTICGRGEGHDGDVYIFPDMIKYEALKESDIDGFVEEVVVNGKPWSSGEQIHFAGSFVFVCAHGSRDKRCGVCGPELMKKLQEEIASRGLESQVFVNSCSHIGGHKYAGNVIIFRTDSEGKSICNWYGYVTPDDVPALLDNDIAKGEIIERLWRGKMGSAAAKEDETGEVPSGQEADQSTKLNEVSKDEASNNATFSCCAGANGVTCCQDVNLKTNGDQDIVTEEVRETKGQDKLSIYGRQFEQREILTAAVVVGALATVAIAYGVYRRSA